MNLEPQLSARKLNQILNEIGLQKREEKNWILSEEGEKWGKEFEAGNYDSSKNYIKWCFETINLIQSELNKES